jgi:hypothetical protein
MVDRAPKAGEGDVNQFGDPALMTERNRQLNQLLETVEQAQHVARQLCNSRVGNDEVKILFGRLEAVRLEVTQLHRGHRIRPFEEIDPKWTGFLP